MLSQYTPPNAARMQTRTRTLRTNDNKCIAPACCDGQKKTGHPTLPHQPESGSPYNHSASIYTCMRARTVSMRLQVCCGTFVVAALMIVRASERAITIQQHTYNRLVCASTSHSTCVCVFCSRAAYMHICSFAGTPPHGDDGY